MMQYVNVKIKQIGDQFACGCVFLRHQCLPVVHENGRYRERLVPEQVVRVPMEFFELNSKFLEITREKPTRPLAFLSMHHMVAWQRPRSHQRYGISPAKAKQFNFDTYADMIQLGEKEIAARKEALSDDAVGGPKQDPSKDPTVQPEPPKSAKQKTKPLPRRS